MRTNDYLLLTDVPVMVSIFDKVCTLQYSESLSGSLFMTLNNGPYMTLKNALVQVFLNFQGNYNCCLITIGIQTVAIFKNSGQSFKIFDSHSRDLHGMPHSYGRCILLNIEGLDNLVTYLQMSCCQPGTVPFEIKGVNVLISGSEANVRTIQQNQKCDHISSSNDNNSKTNANEKQKCSGEISEERHQHLMAQCEYDKKKKANESPESREKRLAHQREYKKNRRANESPEARQKRLARQCEYYKKKNINESAECRENRLARKRAHEKEKCANESAECRENRLARKRAHQREKGANESSFADEIQKFYTTGKHCVDMSVLS